MSLLIGFTSQLTYVVSFI